MIARMSEQARQLLARARRLQDELPRLPKPPEAGGEAETEPVLPFSLVRGTRGYIEKIVHQINGCHERGWYDACAVMIRRLLETLIIEAFENNHLAHQIKNASGDFVYLGDLIDKTLAEPSWNIGRSAKRALKRLKDVGNQSAHSRRFNAHRGDLEKVIPDLRAAAQELLYLAHLP